MKSQRRKDVTGKGKSEFKSPEIRKSLAFFFFFTKGKHECCKRSAEARSLRVGFIGHGKEFFF